MTRPVVIPKAGGFTASWDAEPAGRDLNWWQTSVREGPTRDILGLVRSDEALECGCEIALVAASRILLEPPARSCSLLAGGGLKAGGLADSLNLVNAIAGEASHLGNVDRADVAGFTLAGGVGDQHPPR